MRSLVRTRESARLSFHRSCRADKFKSSSNFACFGLGINDANFALQVEGICESFGQFDAEFNCLAGTNHLAKLHVVESGHNWHGIGVRWNESRNQHCAGLKTRFTLQHAWKYRKARIMPLKHRQIGRQHLACDDVRFTDFGDFVEP